MLFDAEGGDETERFTLLCGSAEVGFEQDHRHLVKGRSANVELPTGLDVPLPSSDDSGDTDQADSLGVGRQCGWRERREAFPLDGSGPQGRCAGVAECGRRRVWTRWPCGAVRPSLSLADVMRFRRVPVPRGSFKTCFCLKQLARRASEGWIFDDGEALAGASG